LLRLLEIAQGMPSHRHGRLAASPSLKRDARPCRDRHNWDYQRP
jgi:hypothetical protein